MSKPVILASGSKIRKELLEKAGVEFEVSVADIDEASVRDTCLTLGADPAKIAMALANAKAKQVSLKHPNHLVIGSDQILEFDGSIFAKPQSKTDALNQLQQLVGRTHKLISAVAVFKNGKSEWDAVTTANMHMRKPTPEYLSEYVVRNWPSVRHSVGCYKLEEEGIRLFSRVDGDYFTILGLPLLELLGYLTKKGVLLG